MRVFSTNHEQYPLGTADPIEDSIWFRRLFSQGEAIVANDAEAIEAWLPGFDAYVAQGYGSLANVPIVISGTTIGLLNLMDAPGHYTAEKIAALRQELPLAALAVLANRM
jgi:GAF domain-containing protein